MTWDSARDHFGEKPESLPACQIKGNKERGLVMALRKAEDDRDYWRKRALKAQEKLNETERPIHG